MYRCRNSKTCDVTLKTKTDPFCEMFPESGFGKYDTDIRLPAFIKEFEPSLFLCGNLARAQFIKGRSDFSYKLKCYDQRFKYFKVF